MARNRRSASAAIALDIAGAERGSQIVHHFCIAGLSAMNFGGYCFAEIPESADPVRVMKYFRGLFLEYQNLV